MSNLSIIESKTDVPETIRDFEERSDSFDGVILLAINKDGSQFMVTSSMSAMQKAFLTQFLNSFMNKWFEHSNA